jgi:hypothetical protein
MNEKLPQLNNKTRNEFVVEKIKEEGETDLAYFLKYLQKYNEFIKKKVPGKSRQIVIKLNKQKFRPLINAIKEIGGYVSQSDAEAIGKILFFSNSFVSEREPKLNNMTRQEFIFEKTKEKDETLLEAKFKFLVKYNEFISAK